MKVASLIVFAIAICYIHAGAANAEDWCQMVSILSTTSVPYCSSCNRDRALHMNTDLSNLWVKCQQVDTMLGCLYKPGNQWSYYTTNTCNICQTDYYLDASTSLCVSGTQTSTGCAAPILDGSTVYCAMCSAGYWPDGAGACATGTVTNCEYTESRYKNSLGTVTNMSVGSANGACLEPKTGYEVDNSALVSAATLTNCAQYYSSTCWRCKAGYVQTQSTATATSCVAYAKIASVFTVAFAAIAAFLF